MNYDNQNWSYSPFPWLEEKLNTDYKIEYINNYKHYAVLSERLKKVMEEEWHQKLPCNHLSYSDNDLFNFALKPPFKWWEEIKKYQEGVDYRIEETVRESGLRDRKYIALSERMKQKFAEWKVGERDPGFEKFANWFFRQGPQDYQKIKEENEKKRQKFIAENNPPKSNYSFLTAEDKLWNKQQPPLTATEASALSDPILEHYEHWERALWFIQKIRQAESDIFPDEDFAWGDFMDKQLKNPTSNDYKAVQALKNAGISLDKLFERVEKGKQAKEKREQERPQKDKEKILNNLNDWILGGSHSIRNLKTNQVLTWDGGTMFKYRFFLEENYHQYDHQVIEVGFDFATFQEIRATIFANLRKNLLQNKDLPKDNEVHKPYEKDNFTPQEWTEIEKYLNKNTSASRGDNNQNKNNNISPIMVITIIGIIILAVGGIVVMKNRRKKGKHGSKR